MPRASPLPIPSLLAYYSLAAFLIAVLPFPFPPSFFLFLILTLFSARALLVVVLSLYYKTSILSLLLIIISISRSGGIIPLFLRFGPGRLYTPLLRYGGTLII